jgi:hypothetical protein
MNAKLKAVSDATSSLGLKNCTPEKVEKEE